MVFAVPGFDGRGADARLGDYRSVPGVRDAGIFGAETDSSASEAAAECAYAFAYASAEGAAEEYVGSEKGMACGCRSPALEDFDDGVGEVMIFR